MTFNNKSKETDIKNRTLYYLDDLINISSLNFERKKLDENLY